MNRVIGVAPDKRMVIVLIAVAALTLAVFATQMILTSESELDLEVVPAPASEAEAAPVSEGSVQAETLSPALRAWKPEEIGVASSAHTLSGESTALAEADDDGFLNIGRYLSLFQADAATPDTIRQNLAHEESAGVMTGNNTGHNVACDPALQSGAQPC